MMAVGSGLLGFCTQFPDERACLEWIFQAKYGGHSPCPACGRIGKWRYLEGTKKYWHSCRRQISPLQGTAFYRSNISLTACFYALSLFANCPSGIRSGFLRKQLGLGNKAAHRLGNRVRLHMAAQPRLEMLGGKGKIVEIDEVLLQHASEPGYAMLQPTLVLGAHCDGRVLSGIIADRRRATLHECITRLIAPQSLIVTDDWRPYRGLEQFGYQHVSVNHRAGFFPQDGQTTGKIDSYWATLRRVMRGYHQVSAANLWLYLAEVECRFNLRNSQSPFNDLITTWPLVDNVTPSNIERRFDWRKSD